MRKLIVFLLLGLASCVVSPERPDNGGADHGEPETVSATLSLQLPGSFRSAKTRSLTEAEENAVTEVCLLVFSEADALEEVLSVPQDNIVGAGNQGDVAIAVSLPTGRHKLVVVANDNALVESNLDAAEDVGLGYGAVKDRLVRTMSAGEYDAAGSLPMWGETGVVDVVEMPEGGGGVISMR